MLRRQDIYHTLGPRGVYLIRRYIAFDIQYVSDRQPVGKAHAMFTASPAWLHPVAMRGRARASFKSAEVIPRFEAGAPAMYKTRVHASSQSASTPPHARGCTEELFGAFRLPLFRLASHTVVFGSVVDIVSEAQ